MTRLLLPMLSLFLVAGRLSAQSLDDKIRISLWFARLLADSTGERRPVVFVFPAASDRPHIDSLRRVLHPAFQRAGFRTATDEREPIGDTVLVTIGAPSAESDTTGGTFYSLFYSKKYRTPECTRTEIYAARVRCTVQSCRFFSESPVGGGEPVECRRRP